jgi:hypothetical protein
MKRRNFAVLLGAAIVLSHAVRAQNKHARIGFIEPGTQEANGLFLTSFRTGMAAQDGTKGKT